MELPNLNLYGWLIGLGVAVAAIAATYRFIKEVRADLHSYREKKKAEADWADLGRRFLDLIRNRPRPAATELRSGSEENDKGKPAMEDGEPRTEHQRSHQRPMQQTHPIIGESMTALTREASQMQAALQAGVAIPHRDLIEWNQRFEALAGSMGDKWVDRVDDLPAYLFQPVEPPEATGIKQQSFLAARVPVLGEMAMSYDRRTDFTVDLQEVAIQSGAWLAATYALTYESGSPARNLCGQFSDQDKNPIGPATEPVAVLDHFRRTHILTTRLALSRYHEARARNDTVFLRITWQDESGRNHLDVTADYLGDDLDVL